MLDFLSTDVRRLPIFVIMIAGNSNPLPTELLRSGRVDRVVFIGPYPVAVQKQILSWLLKRHNLPFTEDALDSVRELSDWTPAEIASVVEEIVISRLYGNDESIVTRLDLVRMFSKKTPMSSVIPKSNLDEITARAQAQNYLIVNGGTGDSETDSSKVEPI